MPNSSEVILQLNEIVLKTLAQTNNFHISNFRGLEKINWIGNGTVQVHNINDNLRGLFAF